MHHGRMMGIFTVVSNSRYSTASLVMYLEIPIDTDFLLL